MAEMNLTNKLYQPEVLDRIGDLTWGPGPYVVELDPTGVCDLACPGCISADIIALGNTFVKDRLLEIGKEIIDSGVKAVVLIGGGEPLAHPRIGDLIELLGENDVHIGITTSGTFIHRYMDAIAKYTSWTRVSMDAATAETYSILRPTKGGGSKFEQVINNIRALARVKTGSLGYSFLIQTSADGVDTNNIGEIYAAAVLARDLGCDYYEVKPSYQFREGVAHALAVHSADLLRRASDEVDKLEMLETDQFKIIQAINLKHSLDGVQFEQPKEYNVCPSTHLRTTITPSGVFVCPYWRGKDRMKIGDLQKESLEEMWNGATRKKVMEQLDPSKDCNFHCLRHDTNVAVYDLRGQLKAGVDVQPVEEFDRFI